MSLGMIDIAMEKAQEDELRQFSNQRNWNLTEAEIAEHSKNSGLPNIYATYGMLDLYIKNPANGTYEPLRDYVTRDEMKIFFIISLLESLQKISNPKIAGSHAAVKKFFETYVDEADKRRVESSFTITKIKEVNSNGIFDDWVEALYGIRSAFAHEVNYICQVFTDVRSQAYEYQNCKAIYKLVGGKKIFWLKKFKTENFSFENFLQLISRAIRSWLVTTKTE